MILKLSSILISHRLVFEIKLYYKIFNGAKMQLRYLSS